MVPVHYIVGTWVLALRVRFNRKFLKWLAKNIRHRLDQYLRDDQYSDTEEPADDQTPIDNNQFLSVV